ncbi:AMP-binding protein [Pseudomaricurvus alkylphenolicus]|uniref:AMP-binding protein n=1 Tax=Pseudomaricurvus alkylphenolicus TaxID=1306991 RepID=UPI00141FC841|nr:AMP-binding protein [Pseudomaricurvus alkylphenolicus]NIB42414.1 AMP-binding protein [Pseudomaricurvus alkylphenolicus]
MSVISFSRILAHWVEIQPNQVAIVHEGDTITWLALEERTNQLARAYEDLGVKQDDFVTIALPNGIEFIAACFAIWKLGATPQPISAKLPKIERDAIIELANPSLVVGAVDADARFPSIAAQFSQYENYSTEPLQERTSKNIKAVTSGGSTGRPKLIVMPQPAVWDLDFTYFMIPHQSSVLVPGPLYHNGPFMWALCALCQGNRTVIVTRFDAETTLQLIEENRIENMYMVPTMMQRIWNLPDELRLKYDLSSLKSAIHMAAPCPAWLKEAFIEWLGPQVVWELYGGAEGQGGTTITGEEWLQHRGSVGKAIEGTEIQILGDSGQQLPPGDIGEIYMRFKENAGSSYEYIGAESKEIEGGWDSLGDMGYLDEDGYLYLADRRTDMIICGGSNIYPAEVEAAIDQFPGVRSSAVIGLPHEDLGNVVHAIVDAPDAAITEDDMLTFLADHLVRYKHPRSIEFVSEPLRDDAGKVRRKALREARIN